MPTDLEWAYLAGLFDGEGNASISVTQHGKDPRPYHGLRVCITSTDRPLLEWVQERFGGKIFRGLPGTRSARPTYNIAWQHAELAFILGGLRRFVVLKAPHIDLALAFRATIRQNGQPRNYITPEVERERDRIHRELNVLNGARKATFLESYRPTAIPPAANCKWGHPLVEGNLRAGGKRQCLTCHRERERARRQG